MTQPTFTRYELELFKEALAMTASRKEAMGRARPRTARKLDLRAADMRRLRAKVCSINPARELPDIT